MQMRPLYVSISVTGDPSQIDGRLGSSYVLEVCAAVCTVKRSGGDDEALYNCPTGFPAKSLNTKTGSRPGVPDTVLVIKKPLVFDYIRDLTRGNKLIVTFAYDRQITQQYVLSAAVPAVPAAVPAAADVMTRADAVCEPMDGSNFGKDITHREPTTEQGSVPPALPPPHVTNEEVLFLSSEEEDEDVLDAVRTAEALVHG